MSLVAKRRELTRRSIQHSPLVISLTRVTKVPDGAGGWIEEEVSLGPQTFRLFISSNQSQTIAQEGGQMQVNQWGLLGEHDANIKTGDTFTLEASEVLGWLHEGQSTAEEFGGYAYGDRKYRIVKVDPVRLLGEVVSVQAVVEEVV